MATNFIIGKGELLTYNIDAPKRGSGPKNRPYSLDEAKKVLIPQIKAASNIFNKLPIEATPQGISVAKMTLHPAFIAKSYFPNQLLRYVGLISVGSRSDLITPRKQVKIKASKRSETTQLLVAGTKASFEIFSEYALSLTDENPTSLQFAEIEDFSAMESSDRIKPLLDNSENVFEVGLHLLPDSDAQTTLRYFAEYAISLGYEVITKFQFISGKLLFLPIQGNSENLAALGNFSLLRIVRSMPGIRVNRPIPRSTGVPVQFKLPSAEPLSREPKVAILDGGFPREEHGLERFVSRYYLSDENAADVEDYNFHGLAVTSAFLFGPIEPNTVALRPYSYVDHHRVLDRASDKEDPFELYRTLQHVEDILASKLYQFINLSLGPDLSIEDAEVHAWTAVIDELLSDGNTLMTVAVGNNGERDHALGLNRVQVPSDSVNALSVGASDRTGDLWNRASYSARGPGRSPGRRKPDLISFGGCPKEYFHHVAPGNIGQLAVNLGTSFAAPFALRTAVGIRAVLGSDVYPLTIKALLVHATQRHVTADDTEVGWGRVPEDINEIITCGNGVARIIYQGVLKPGKFLRAPVPLPNGELKGKVKITATFCYASPTDAQDACAYTKAGLEITFRPHEDKFKKDATNATSQSFFPTSEFRTEAELRDDLGKWETVLHQTNGYNGSSLKGSVFDIHYNARQGGGVATGSAELIPYALVVTVQATNHPNLYNDILAAHTVLKALEPQVHIPLNI